MPKRAALLLDQFLLALQKAVDHGKSSVGSTSYKQVVSKSPTHRFLAANSEIFPIVDDQMVMNSKLIFKQSYSKRSQYLELPRKAS